MIFLPIDLRWLVILLVGTDHSSHFGIIWNSPFLFGRWLIVSTQHLKVHVLLCKMTWQYHHQNHNRHIIENGHHVDQIWKVYPWEPTCCHFSSYIKQGNDVWSTNTWSAMKCRCFVLSVMVWLSCSCILEGRGGMCVRGIHGWIQLDMHDTEGKAGWS